MLKSKFLRFFVLIALSTMVGGCSLPSKNQVSILVIAVENLGVNQINCNTDPHTNLHSGFDLLCEQSVRFTHSFTPSILSGPALASILTAQYPAVHGFRNHGRSALSSRLVTLAEIAQKKSYATSLFSGGPPILRKHNLHQGFDVFDDNFIPNPKTFFRSLGKTESLFKAWLKDVGSQPFLSVIYAPDLLFPNTETVNDFGESRNLSFESQLEELDEALHSYFADLKEAGRWDQTLVVLVGLNGPSTERWGELNNTNLLSERAQVALLMKPPGKKRDTGLSWTIDANVSLVDVGATLWDYIANEVPPSRLSLESVSLKTALQTTKVEWDPERMIAVESGWPEWQSDSFAPWHGIRYSLRKGYFVFLDDQNPKVYNSLIDRFETSPTSLYDSAVRTSSPLVMETFGKLEWLPWTPVTHFDVLKLKALGYAMTPTLAAKQREQSLKNLIKKDPEDRRVKNLLAYDYLSSGNWAELSHLLDTQKLLDNPCVKLVKAKIYESKDLKTCEDPIANEFIEWFHDENSDVLKRKFLRSYYYSRIDQKIVEMNLHLQALWDTPEKDLKELRLIDVLLALPETEKFAIQIQRYMATYQSENSL